MRDLITLPLPPTTNHIYRIGRGVMYKSPESKAWELECGWLLKKAWKRKTLSTPVYVSLSWFLKFDRDIDGGIKPALDLLQRQEILRNDSQVEHLNVLKFKDKENPRVEIEIVELAERG